MQRRDSLCYISRTVRFIAGGVSVCFAILSGLKGLMDLLADQLLELGVDRVLS